ncbi:hypothetical protein RND81_14G182900 [Saponaria officinalis]|uniref:Uncharacterized protein n=1 Tax=Saponaria officinalis TaxID=3572 RepID=A0AAW1GNL3_SAPOF
MLLTSIRSTPTAVLAPLVLKVGNGDNFFPRNRRWNFNNKNLVDSTTFERWAVVNFSTRCDVRNHVRDLNKCAGMKSITISRLSYGNGQCAAIDFCRCRWRASYCFLALV